MKKHKKLLVTLISILAVFAFVAGIFFGYTAIYYHAVDVDTYLESSSTVQVENNSNSITFKPLDKDATTGFIFYPGAKVEAEAYAPLARKLAEDDIYTVIVKMPFHLAMFGINKADSVISSTPSISSWYLGGHSLGGAMGSIYTSRNYEKLDGLVLLASYSTKDLSSLGLKVATIVGSNDQVMKANEFEKNKVNLPSNTSFNTIEGGNHGNFASYGHQKGDGEATITMVEQINQTATIIENLIKA